MYRYIINRVLLVFPTLAGAAALVFILMRLIPGDICLVRLGSGGTSFTTQALATCHAEIGIDRPWILQYLEFLWDRARFDFGTSMGSGKPVIMEIATRFPISLEVAVMATVSAVVLAIPIGYRYAAVSMRMTRSAMLEVLREDYIRTARAKGLINRIVITRHALKNAMLPVVTVIGIEFAFLIGGLVVTEQVFNLNGIGRLMVLSVQNQDYTLTQALVMLTVTIAVLSNLVVDLLYAWLDPRIRLA